MKTTEIVSQLKSRGVEVTEDRLTSFLSAHNLTVEDLTDSTAIDAIATDLKAGSALATAPKAGKAAKAQGGKRNTRGDRAKSSASTLNTVMTTAAQSTAVELDAFVGVVDSAAGQYEEATAQRLVDRIREVPVNVIQRVGELAAQEVADPETFRDAARSLFSGTCFDFTSDEA